ncbi:MAG: GNAT family N-acetyltransferase [Pseudomonadota bacterium]
MTYSFRYRAQAEALVDALVDDAFYQAMTESAARASGGAFEAMCRYMDFSMREAQASGRLSLAPAESPGAAIWALPRSASESERLASAKQTFLDTQMGEESVRCYARIVANMSALSAPVIPEGAWYLSILGITPNRQSRGVGRALLERDLEAADADGVPAYLETFCERNHSFYERLGFRTAKSVPEPETNAVYTVMVRDAKRV